LPPLGAAALLARVFVCRFGLGLVIGLFFSTSAAPAILIETDPGRVGGFVLDDDGTKLKIRIPMPDGQEKVEEYFHAKIKIIHQLDTKRLEGLSPNNLKAYCDYAAELARQEADPEARVTAMHLYFIAAKLAPEKFGYGSLLSMSALANTPAEARKYRAVAFVLNPKAGAEILKMEAVKPSLPAQFPARALEDFIKALQLYRAGQTVKAKETAKRDGVDKIFPIAPGNIERKDFIQWCDNATCTTCRTNGTVVCPTCKGSAYVVNGFNKQLCSTCNGKRRIPCPDCDGTHVRDPLPDDVLRLVLRCELWAMDLREGGSKAGWNDATDAKSWSSVLQSSRMYRVLPLSLETITGFDLRKCRYRNRMWVE
jgi:hypothetical protein